HGMIAGHLDAVYGGVGAPARDVHLGVEQAVKVPLDGFRVERSAVLEGDTLTQRDVEGQAVSRHLPLGGKAGQQRDLAVDAHQSLGNVFNDVVHGGGGSLNRIQESASTPIAMRKVSCSRAVPRNRNAVSTTP